MLQVTGYSPFNVTGYGLQSLKCYSLQVTVPLMLQVTGYSTFNVTGYWLQSL